MFKKSDKYDALLQQYEIMARNGFKTKDGRHVDKPYAQQEAVKFRGELKRLFDLHGVCSVLDYGAGGRPWDQCEVPEGGLLTEFTGLQSYHAFEPSRGQLDRPLCDAVCCFDVLEHIFVADVGYVLNDIFSHAGKLVIMNVACYPARALLPNGENAHSTLRPPTWWKGAVDMIASAYPDVTVALYCSERYNNATRMGEANMSAIIAADGFQR